MQFISILTAFLICVNPASLSAQPLAPGPVPFAPALIENRIPALCDPFLSHWTRTHFSRTGNTEIIDAFPEAEFLSFRSSRQGSTHRFQQHHAYTSLVDLNGDGTTEVLHLEPEIQGWHALKSNLYHFASIADYAQAVRSPDHQSRYHNPPHIKGAPALEPPPRLLMHYASPTKVHVFRIDGGLYTISPSSSRYSSRGMPVEVSLHRLHTDQPSVRICKVRLMPDLASFDDFVEHSDFFRALENFYGSPGHYDPCKRTSSGLTPAQPRKHLQTVFHQPWMMDTWHIRRHSRARPQDDTAREIRLLIWGTSDPTSWQNYLQLKSGRAQFLSDMATYYQLFMGHSEQSARHLAEKAHLYLTDKVVYYWYPDNYRLSGVAYAQGSRLSFNANTTPSEIARGAVSEWTRLDTPRTGDVNSGWNPLADATLAAIYAELAPDTVAQFVARLNNAIEKSLAEAETTERREWLSKHVANISARVFLASLNNPDTLAATLELVDGPDMPTNGFGKTALMYAAQQNNIKAARLLLTARADPNIATQTLQNQCVKLERDGRTALMYAAENAAPELISLLLDSNASPAARDSKGHWALWYLYRNPNLTDAEKRALRERLIPRE